MFAATTGRLFVRQVVSSVSIQAAQGCSKVVAAATGGASKMSTPASAREWARAVHVGGGGQCLTSPVQRCAAAEAKAAAPAFGSTPAGQALRRAMSTGAGPAAEGPSPGLVAAVLAFPKAQPFWFNIMVATGKTSAADLLTQVVVEGKELGDVDWMRNMVFVAFGAVYLGGFQYWLQVNKFGQWFPTSASFSNASFAAKLKDTAGQIGLIKQILFDVGIHLPFMYFPTFYAFKEFVQGTSWNPVDWVKDGCHKYFFVNFQSDVTKMLSVWVPADMLCFSVPLWLRLPVRHVISFVWTAYLSFLHGAKKD